MHYLCRVWVHYTLSVSGVGILYIICVGCGYIIHYLCRVWVYYTLSVSGVGILYIICVGCGYIIHYLCRVWVYYTLSVSGVGILYIIICLTHANVWESMGKPCSCMQFIKSRIFLL